MEPIKVLGIVLVGLLGWGGLTLVSHSEDIASAKTDFEYIKEDIREIKVDVREIKDVLIPRKDSNNV